MVLKPSLHSRRLGPSACSSANSWERRGHRSSPPLVPSPHTLPKVCLTGSSSSKNAKYRPSLPPGSFLQENLTSQLLSSSCSQLSLNIQTPELCGLQCGTGLDTKHQLSRSYW